MQSVIYDEESCSQSDSISLGSSLPAVSASGIEVIEKTTQQPRQPLPEEQKRHISKKITEAQKLIKFYDELKSNKVEFKGMSFSMEPDGPEFIGYSHDDMDNIQKSIIGHLRVMKEAGLLKQGSKQAGKIVFADD